MADSKSGHLGLYAASAGGGRGRGDASNQASEEQIAVETSHKQKIAPVMPVYNHFPPVC